MTSRRMRCEDVVRELWPLLDGALETVAAGIVSSLQPANVRLRRALRNDFRLQSTLWIVRQSHTAI